MGPPSSLVDLVLVLVVAGAASIAFVVAPFLLPWRHRVRWAQAMASAQVATGVPSLCSLGESTILALALHPSGARLTLAESGHRPAGEGIVSLTGPGATVVGLRHPRAVGQPSRPSA